PASDTGGRCRWPSAARTAGRESLRYHNPPSIIARPFGDMAREGWRPRRATGNMIMVRLKSEIEVTCPCCQATLVVDTNLGRVVSTKEAERGNKPELSDAQRILADEAARREAIFQ